MTGTPITLTNEDADKLLNELKHECGSQKKENQGIRNHCIAVLMLDAGLRVGEVVQLHQHDLVLAGVPVTSLRIRTEIAKNKTERIVPLSERLLKSIETMQQRCWADPYSQTGRYAFYQSYWTQPLTTRQVERIIRKAAMMSLGRPVHPHVLRHTFASRLMRTTNARTVQELLGHKHMSTTQIYMHPNEDDKKKAIRSLEPNQPNKNDTAARSTSTADIANGTDTMNANRDMR